VSNAALLILPMRGIDLKLIKSLVNAAKRQMPWLPQSWLAISLSARNSGGGGIGFERQAQAALVDVDHVQANRTRQLPHQSDKSSVRYFLTGPAARMAAISSFKQHGTLPGVESATILTVHLTGL
jgi:hypothetical protein